MESFAFELNIIDVLLSALKLIMTLDKNPFLFNIFTLVRLEMWQIVSCCQIIMRKIDYVYSAAPPVNDVFLKQKNNITILLWKVIVLKSHD